MPGFKVSEILSPYFEKSFGQARELLAFMVKENGDQSVDVEVREITQSSQTISASNQRLSKLLNPGMWQRVFVRDAAAVDRDVVRLADEMRSCQEHSMVCASRLRTKIETIDQHVAAVLSLRLRLQSDVSTVRAALNQVAQQESSPLLTAEIYNASVEIISEVLNIDKLLELHVSSIREHLTSVDKALSVTRKMQIMVDAAVQSGAPSSAKLVAAADQFRARAKSDFLTLDEQKLIQKSQSLEIEGWPVQLIKSLAVIPNPKATWQLLRWLSVARSEKQIELMRLAFNGRTINSAQLPPIQLLFARALRDSGLRSAIDLIEDQLLNQDDQIQATRIFISLAADRAASDSNFSKKWEALVLTDDAIPLVTEIFSRAKAFGTGDEALRELAVVTAGRIQSVQSQRFLADVATGRWVQEVTTGRYWNWPAVTKKSDSMRELARVLLTAQTSAK
ncbi:MAG: hypothetical protein EOP05_01125 [Proteobacteria bacterium]|nr:MAG: hypothetical protein EOP05_01125 [Pseudomonadota bacterium]